MPNTSEERNEDKIGISVARLGRLNMGEEPNRSERGERGSEIERVLLEREGIQLRD